MLDGPSPPAQTQSGWGQNRRNLPPASVFVWAEGGVTREEPRARAGALRKGAGARLLGERERAGALAAEAGKRGMSTGGCRGCWI